MSSIAITISHSVDLIAEKSIDYENRMVLGFKWNKTVKSQLYIEKQYVTICDTKLGRSYKQKR